MSGFSPLFFCFSLVKVIQRRRRRWFTFCVNEIDIFHPFLFCFSFIKMTIILSSIRKRNRFNGKILSRKSCVPMSMAEMWVVNGSGSAEMRISSENPTELFMQLPSSLLLFMCSSQQQHWGSQHTQREKKGSETFQNFIKFCSEFQQSLSGCERTQNPPGKKKTRKWENFVIISKTYCIKAPISRAVVAYQQLLIKEQQILPFLFVYNAVAGEEAENLIVRFNDKGKQRKKKL